MVAVVEGVAAWSGEDMAQSSLALRKSAVSS